jgi:hypothetical protein
MKTYATLPVGNNKKDTKMLSITRGDILELVTGEKAVFMEMKRTKWVGRIGNKIWNIPIYRNKYSLEPYAIARVGKDTSVISVGAKPATMKAGQLFSIEGHKETFMYVGLEKKGQKMAIVGIDLASGKRFRIDQSFKFFPINLNTLKTTHLK